MLDLSLKKDCKINTEEFRELVWHILVPKNVEQEGISPVGSGPDFQAGLTQRVSVWGGDSEIQRSLDVWCNLDVHMVDLSGFRTNSLAV